MICGTSNAKLIVSGEHSVVFGMSALAIPISLTLKATLTKSTSISATQYARYISEVFGRNINKPLGEFHWKIVSEIPQDSGLGSSAAFAYALLQALANYFQRTFSKSEYFDLIQECEVFAHGKPSGIDAASVVFGKPLIFNPRAKRQKISFLSSAVLPPFVLIQSGPALESTKEMVKTAALNVQAKHLASQIGAITKKIVSGFSKGSLELRLISENERLLEALGVIGERAQKMVRGIEEIGGFAKVCGAGGIREGSGVILAFHPEIEKLTLLVNQNKWEQIYPKVV